ncbi:DUF551 domain-containing protein [Escherichia coli]|uniref:DUF551 domain-containing protein n=1 Tax=Escherichia coli TaxID=562 RepID=UPI000DFAD016
MINRTKLEHILEYARQQRRFGQHCKIPPGDMVEIVEIAMRKAGNYPVTPDGWISCSEQMPDDDRIQFSVSLPAACGGDKYFIDGVFQPLRYERDCEKAVVAAGGVVNWVK